MTSPSLRHGACHHPCATRVAGSKLLQLQAAGDEGPCSSHSGEPGAGSGGARSPPGASSGLTGAQLAPPILPGRMSSPGGSRAAEGATVSPDPQWLLSPHPVPGASGLLYGLQSAKEKRGFKRARSLAKGRPGLSWRCTASPASLVRPPPAATAKSSSL